MAEHKRPDWVKKAAMAVAAYYGAERVKENVQAREAKIKTDVQQAEEKIADIIHRHFQAQK